ncbi:hypothetical protein [Microcoleus sp. herbarium14]|uniref:hypothetical protein n=1 Tax=Microcoleus sp. herbarium14 TaxID=3055439 RepID=UPI002FD21DC5
MTIYFNPATEKYPAKLNISLEKLTVADIIGIQELIVSATADSLDMTMILSESCIGIESRERTFKPANSKCNLTFKREKKQQYDVEQKKYVEVEVSKDENYLFLVLSDYFTQHPANGYTGQIQPWINPFFWELINQNTPVSIEMAEGMKNKLFTLQPLETLSIFTDDDKIKLTNTTNYGGSKTGYAKAETEAEKIAARLYFFKTQTASLIDWQTIGELGVILPGLDAEMREAVNLAIELTIKLIGGK